MKLSESCFSTQTDKFRWTKTHTEMTTFYSSETELDVDFESTLLETNEALSDEFTFDFGSHVAVLSEDLICPFWIGQVHSISTNCEDVITMLTVHWPQAEDSFYDGS